MQKETGNLNLRSALKTEKDQKQLFEISIVRPAKMLFFSPIVLLLSLYMAIVYGYLYLMFTTFPRVFQGQYGFSNSSIGLAYLGVGIGSLVGLVFCGIVSDRLVKTLTKRNGGTSKPEYRLPIMLVGALVVPIGLFLYGWSADKKLHWIVPIIGTAFLGSGMFCIFVSHSVPQIEGTQLTLTRCRRRPTSLMHILSTLLRFLLQQLFFARSLELCFHWPVISCMMHLELVGAHR
jgi:MFS family permease